LASPVFAQSEQIVITVNTSGFLGHWRFAESTEGPNIGDYCDPNNNCTPAESIIGDPVIWYRGDHVVAIEAPIVGSLKTISFEIQAGYGNIPIELGGADVISAKGTTPPAISLSGSNGSGTLTINLAKVLVDANGYRGRCGFEQLYTKVGGNSESCGGSTVHLPLGTSWNLVVGGHQLFPVFVGHDGTPHPYSTNGQLTPLSLQRNHTLVLRTIDVRLTPMANISWSMADASDPKWADGKTTGAQTVRLPRFSQYQIGVHFVGGGSSGANFTLPGGCDNRARTLYIPDYASIFTIQQQCGSERR